MADTPFDHCARVVRANARNFYWAFLLLPPERKRAMYALYAFCRLADDIADEPGSPDEKLRRFEELEAGIESLYAGAPSGPVFEALAAVFERTPVPREYLREIVAGTRQDVSVARYATFEELRGYCWKVASMVGVVTIRLHGLDERRLEPYARAGGTAVQLTNILRDVREDRERGRVYLPVEELARFGVSEGDLVASPPPERVRELFRFQAARAAGLYSEAAAAITAAERRVLAPLEISMQIYRRLLAAIVRSGFDVATRRISVPASGKVSAVLGFYARRALRLPPQAV